MTRTRLTNPAYAYLAYRRAIMLATINHLRETYTTINGTDPKGTIVCEEVFQADAEVPNDEILQFIEELQEREAHLKLEMNKFEFIKKDDGEDQEQKAAPSGGSRKKKTGKGRR